MAVFEASKVRAVTIELKERSFELYAALLPIVTELGTWTLNGSDPTLPAPFDVKVQLDAYKALSIQRLQLTEWVLALQAALADDTLTYPTPPVFFDGGAGIFDGGGAPEG